MSIETCSFLRPSLKAKLQDSGVLHLDELLPLFRHAPSASPVEKQTQGSERERRKDGKEEDRPSRATAEEQGSGASCQQPQQPQRPSEPPPFLPSSSIASTSPTTTDTAHPAHPGQLAHAAQAANATAAAVDDTADFVLRCDDTLASTLARRLPRLSRDDVFDLIACTTSFLAHHQGRGRRRCGGGGGSSGNEHAPDEPAESLRLFTTRTLGEVVDAALFGGGGPCAPNSARVGTAGGPPTHATTFSSALDNLLGEPDDWTAEFLRDGEDNDGVARSPVRRRARVDGAAHRPSPRPSGKGVEVGKVTEVSGPPGAGKTQLLLQLAVSCAMPTELGGLAGDCLFVDTEGGFALTRLREVALAAVALVHGIARQRRAVAASSAAPQGPAMSSAGPCEANDGPDNSAALAAVAEDFTLALVLQRIHYVRVTDTATFLAVLHSIPHWVETECRGRAEHTGSDSAAAQEGVRACEETEERGVKVRREPPTALSEFCLRMILVDSIAAPLRTLTASEPSAAARPLGGAGPRTAGPATQRQRSSIIFRCGALLREYACRFHLAVVASNQVTSRAVPLSSLGSLAPAPAPAAHRERADDGGFTTVLVPALGDAWAVHASTRLLLTYHHYKLPWIPHSAAAPSGLPARSGAVHADDGRRATEGSGSGDAERRDSGAESGRSRAAGEEAEETRLLRQRLLCPEDIAFCYAASSSRVSQHRVARLVKHDANPRTECCFAISSKGIRDAKPV